MIHSDANNAGGVGGITLEKGLKRQGLSSDECYTIGLIGGQSDKALQHKLEQVRKTLPNLEVVFKKSRVNYAYLLGDRQMFCSKRELCEGLGVEKVNIILGPQPGLSR